MYLLLFSFEKELHGSTCYGFCSTGVCINLQLFHFRLRRCAKQINVWDINPECINKTVVNLEACQQHLSHAFVSRIKESANRAIEQLMHECYYRCSLDHTWMKSKRRWIRGKYSLKTQMDILVELTSILSCVFIRFKPETTCNMRQRNV